MRSRYHSKKWSTSLFAAIILSLSVPLADHTAVADSRGVGGYRRKERYYGHWWNGLTKRHDGHWRNRICRDDNGFW